MESMRLEAVEWDGSTVAVMFEIRDKDGTGLWMRLADEEWASCAGSNLFACLMAARVDLERRGLLLCCQAARANVFPSGMQQQMGNGRFARVLAEVTPGGEEVDILEAAESSQVVSVEDQRLAVFKFFGFAAA